MSLERKYSIYRKIAVFIAINLLIEIIAPTAAWALTGGPSSPEFSSFEPVATTNMVSEFSGDLTYNLPVINVPGANGGGYAMSLSYHSGATTEEEASWVGYGWTLNPGAINRGKKGFPDDWDNESVKYYNKTPANETVAIGGSLGNIEAFSFDLPVNVNSSIRYNNNKGFGYTIGAGISLAKGVVSLGYNISDGSGSFSLSVNPAGLLSGNKKKGEDGDKKAGKGKEARDKKNEAQFAQATKDHDAKKGKKPTGSKRGALAGLGSGYGLHNFASASRPTQIVGYDGNSTTLSLSLLLAPSPLQTGIAAGTFGSYSRQENHPTSILNTYGYMYSSNASSDATAMMDYFVEKGSTYTKQDKFLGIPFSNADNYSLTGEGLTGGFKIHNRNVGHFRPNQELSETFIFNAGPEFEVGLNYGGGGDIGVGYQSLSIGEWSPSGQEFSSNEDESNFFRFANDKGGELSYDGGNTSAKQANVDLTSSFKGMKAASPDITIAPITGERSLRSSYIGYNTNEEMGDIEGVDDVAFRAYSKNTDSHVSNGSIDRSKLTQIGEFSIVNEDGNRYNYGIPVLSQNEQNIQVDLNGVSGEDIKNKFIVYRNSSLDDGSYDTKVGEERETSYATSYLLTEITSPDYIDRTNDGPSEDDFGGYTAFDYARAHSAYRWRMPYDGLSYSRNELSSTKDDLGSVASGEKEVYYLETVETKTHRAIFHTSKRRDGLDAAGESTASTTEGAKGSNKLEKLDKIELFAKDLKNPSAVGKLIKTVHFDYDYSTAVGVLNYNDGTDSENPLHNEGGKLTLKKVWFEYNGVVEAKISPYQFEYNYPTTAEAQYPGKYVGLEDYGQLYASNPDAENPDFSSFNIDAWGNYQYAGASRFDKMQPWLDQSGSYSSSFDPAAWQLKVVKLPSGGEIHVQYEQDDYCYVQDKQAHAMVSLTDGTHDSGLFTINTADLGISGPTALADNQKLAEIINKEYVVGGKKMYFKMLYKLIGNSTPNLDDCNVEYITGYANVSSATGTANGILIALATGGYVLPKDVCNDYVTSQRAGSLSFVGSNCDPSETGIGNGTPTEKVLAFMGQAVTWLTTLAPGTTCLTVNYEESYLKIPLLDAKKGGGLRVKRLLMFDKGLDTGGPELYGSEYIYQAYDENRKEYRSSGVATNEPGSIREENALVGFLDRFKQSFGSKVISGRDKKQAEGPIGESILPGASVGYSRVITKSIHSGKTSPGFAIKEFNTAKDYPVKMEMTGIDAVPDYLPFISGLVNKITNNLWMSQGFAFEVNSMHGQLKSTSTYSGEYSSTLDLATSTLVSQEILEYYQPGEEVPVMNLDDLSINSTLPLGRDMDIVTESKAVKDINIDGNVELDADAGLFGIVLFPFLTAFPTLTYTETELYTHTTTKVTSYPAIVKKTTSLADGIYHISENIAFNPETGQPMVTRTTDGFDHLDLLTDTDHKGDYTKYNFPASLQYENVSQKAKSERKKVNTVGDITIERIAENGKMYLSFSATPPTKVCDAMANFVGGDLIELSTGGIYHTGDITGSKLEIQPTYYSSPGSDGVTNVEIIRSGRTNQLNEQVGSLTTYGTNTTVITPIDPVLLAEREAFAVLLTNSLTSATPLKILPAQIPAGITFANADGSCSALDDDNYIIVEGNEVNIYGPDILINQDVVIVPNHPMVAALNNYINTYWDYPLGLSASSIYKCGSLYQIGLYEMANTIPGVAAMRALQATDLAASFSDVNNGTHAIDEFLVDEGVDLGFTTAKVVLGPTDIPIDMINKRVVLEEISTDKIMGAAYVCSGRATQYISGCADGENTDYRYDPLFSNYFSQDGDGYLVFNGGFEQSCNRDIRFYYLEGGIPVPNLLCSSTLEMSEGYGKFAIDPKTAALVYHTEDNDCYGQDVPCIRFCNEEYPLAGITNVVASEASTLSDKWDYDETRYGVDEENSFNDYELGKRGKWRTDQTYAYKTEVEGQSTNADKNYEAGIYDLELFNWGNLNANGKDWLALNTVKKYSPNGNALEEENILGIKSSAKFGYHNTLPYFIAQNADYASIAFESFENDYGAYKLEDGVVYDPLDGEIDEAESHSGGSSFKLTFPANDGLEMTEMAVTEQVLTDGMLFKVWIKTDFSDRSILDLHLKAGLEDVENSQYVASSFKKVAQVGEWYLYEAKMLPEELTGMTLGNVLKTFVKYEFTAHGSEQVWIDDVRIQPMNSQATAYVYDVNTHRLLTTFDDQHFGLYYQYNAEGKLVRKLIETERGMKTVQETQYNTPKIPK